MRTAARGLLPAAAARGCCPRTAAWGLLLGGCCLRTAAWGLLPADFCLTRGGSVHHRSPVNSTADTTTYGSSFVLWDNLWGTNYIMWWPFVVPPPADYARSSRYFPTRSNNDMLSRFTIRFADP